MLQSLRVGLFLAVRMLRRGQKGLVITPIIVMAITYINLLFIPGIVAGAITANKQKLRETLISDYVIQPQASEESITGVTEKLSAIEQLDGIQAVTSVLQVGNRITTQNNGGYWTVLAIDPGSYNKVFINDLQQGAFVTDDLTPTIALGSRIVGSSSEKESTALGGIQVDSDVEVLLYEHGDRRFSVKGVFDNSFYDADVRAFISRSYLETLDPGSRDRATKLFVKTRSGMLPEGTLQQLHAIVGTAQILHTDTNSSSFEEQAATYRDIGQAIGFMAILVAAIVIFIVTYIDLLQRRRQIGIQRAIGIRNSTIVISYVTRVTLTTVLGIGLGALLFRFGIVTYFNAHPLELRNGEVRIVTSSGQFLGYALFLVGTALLAAIIPTLREVHQRLLDAIWGSN